MNLSERIKMAREYVGLDQKGLAEKVGISQQMVSRLETGKADGSSHLIRIAQVCRVNPFWLYDESYEMVDEKSLTEEEQRHLQLFREASPKTRRAVENVYEIEKQDISPGQTRTNNNGPQERAA
ncbi:Helix-turn-helix domain-containing protein [Methylomagnum ishizawai]|uniref:Helix-turn-helix domain-containing protein n=1 Tax=Methylomagnum ishizawai TaxID=1760988 RepID=A0A1Y6CZF2_9GAMM|nr:helix-turn-helix transcriptional regulator [Methylomagnum ishizawai]SMF96069.1 Helix-turn-helix domain-containing protein [Methylomagnum ishizawai]